MAKKKAFVLRVQPEMMEALEKWAQDEFRSVNGQIEYLLNAALVKSGRKKSVKKTDSE
ncbi:MAG: Arc family DNA binding domain-containing protein [Marinilabiliales bacterium]|nr:MAG: Arc family DNA binding domain-containing protein [Marinilabiliales bacterium]